jgi:hypothetical protein
MFVGFLRGGWKVFRRGRSGLGDGAQLRIFRRRIGPLPIAVYPVDVGRGREHTNGAELAGGDDFGISTLLRDSDHSASAIVVARVVHMC